MRKPRPKSKCADYPEADWLLSNDRHVIDLHLDFRKVRLFVTGRKWEGLSNLAAFDFELASLFAASIGFVSKEMAIVYICQDDEYQLSALQSKDVGNRWRIITKRRDDPSGRQSGSGEIRVAFAEAARTEPTIRDKIDEWVILWQCWPLAGKNIRALAQLFVFPTRGSSA